MLENDSEKTLCKKSMIVYGLQVMAIFLIIIAAVCNLSFRDEDKEMWITLLCSSMGYLLPNPSMKRRRRIPPKNTDSTNGPENGMTDQPEADDLVENRP